MSLFEEYERFDLYLSDAEHGDAMDQVCRCGNPAAFYPGQTCGECWNANGRPLPRFPHHDDHDE